MNSNLNNNPNKNKNSINVFYNNQICSNNKQEKSVIKNKTRYISPTDSSKRHLRFIIYYKKISSQSDRL